MMVVCAQVGLPPGVAPSFEFTSLASWLCSVWNGRDAVGAETPMCLPVLNRRGRAFVGTCNAVGKFHF